ncbi:MAG TPA: LacI family DNA-binding transcriptional regulator [Vicinamibacterales bacterium]|jgi:LacI family repressor for deo operon, udp, cdd, tsx, nupC, and nupG|nr:LacI family DNA-binding transcriptional regulator [Vicinamibacterales bacterium]
MAIRPGATIHQVAKRAGVSTATVSRVLSHPAVVAPVTRQRVQRAVDALGYIPNSAASNLRTLRTRKLLVTVPDLSNPFFSLILQGIEDAALRAGYSVLVGDTQHDEQREEGYARMLKRREADGLIFLGHRLPKEAAAVVRAAAPACAPVVNGCEFSPRLGIPGVHIDNAKAAAEAMAHLYSLGHRRIGIVTGPLVSPLSRDRLHGATLQARRTGADRGLMVVQGDFSIESGVAAVEQLFKGTQPPTAVFCFNDEMAIGVLNAARQRRLVVPRDLSVIGFDDIRFAQYSEPPLTTVAQPMREIGERLVRMILDILEGGVSNPASITLPHRLVLRATTGPARRGGRP